MLVFFSGQNTILRRNRKGLQFIRRTEREISRSFFVLLQQLSNREFFAHAFDEVSPDSEVDLCGRGSTLAILLANDVDPVKERHNFAVSVEDGASACTTRSGEIVPDQQVTILAGILEVKVRNSHNISGLHGSDRVGNIHIAVHKVFHGETEECDRITSFQRFDFFVFRDLEERIVLFLNCQDSHIGVEFCT